MSLLYNSNTINILEALSTYEGVGGNFTASLTFWFALISSQFVINATKKCISFS